MVPSKITGWTFTRYSRIKVRPKREKAIEQFFECPKKTLQLLSLLYSENTMFLRCKVIYLIPIEQQAKVEFAVGH